MYTHTHTHVSLEGAPSQTEVQPGAEGLWYIIESAKASVIKTTTAKKGIAGPKNETTAKTSCQTAQMCVLRPTSSPYLQQGASTTTT